ncbi:MAG: hypothetical protein GW947_01820 [Candidatus Pacebacteria bacterium]|nr:hypothetical protein [Candidatus Paceibacterota bacterium]PIR61209.1 MAG: hypothetical protein COU68_00605 [Candidatus Pacebacteria bacterium CG10_big_fil_rev_8_21_14_0_10_45_6]
MKHRLSLLFILIICLLAARTLFTNQIVRGDDSDFHGARLANYYLAIKQGQLLPAWAPNLNYGYGYPMFLFSYQTLYLLGSFFFALGFSIELSVNLVLVLSIFLAGTGMYIFGVLETKRPWLAAVVAAVYVTSPYLLLDIFVRIAAAEVVFLGLLPWMLLLIKLRNKLVYQPLLWFLFWSLTVAWLLSHPLLVMLSVPLLLGLLWRDGFFVELQQKVWQPWLKSFLLLAAVSIGSSLFFWLPLIFEKKFTVLSSNILVKEYYLRFPTLLQLFWTGWGYNGLENNGATNIFPIMIGPIFWLLFAISAFLIFRRKKTNKLPKTLYFWSIVFTASTFLLTSYSKTIWDISLVLPLLMFPWRLLWMPVLAGSMLLLIIGKHHLLQKKLELSLLILVATVASYQAIFYARPASYISKPEIEWFEYPMTATTWDELLTREWDAHKNLRLTEAVVLKPAGKLLFDDNNEIIGSIGSVQQQFWNGTQMRYSIKTDQPATIVQKTMYFPGWVARVDGITTEIIHSDPEFPGRLEIPVTAGEHTIEVQFTKETWPKKLGLYISIASVAIGLLTLKRTTSQRNHKRHR